MYRKMRTRKWSRMVTRVKKTEKGRKEGEVNGKRLKRWAGSK